MFRRERPQKGRYRQFYQIGAEVLGQSDAPAIDAEVIEMLLAFFEKAGLANATLSVNSIGDKNCRPQYIELLRDGIAQSKRSTRPRQPAPNRNKSLTSSGFQTPRRTTHNRRTSAHSRSSLRKLLRPFRQTPRRTKTPRHKLRNQLAPSPRPRLLHPHHFRNRSPRPRLAKCSLRRRTLRRLGRIARRPANKRNRLRHRHRSPDSLAARNRQSRRRKKASTYT